MASIVGPIEARGRRDLKSGRANQREDHHPRMPVNDKHRSMHTATGFVGRAWLVDHTSTNH